MQDVPPDLDIQAYGRGLALQQVEMLTRLAEIGMQLAEGAGARALAVQAMAARPPAEAERTRRRHAVAAAMKRAFAGIRDQARVPGLEAGLAIRLQEPDVIEWLDTETTATIADRLCRSLGLGLYIDDPKVEPDTG